MERYIDVLPKDVIAGDEVAVEGMHYGAYGGYGSRSSDFNFGINREKPTFFRVVNIDRYNIVIQNKRDSMEWTINEQGIYKARRPVQERRISVRRFGLAHRSTNTATTLAARVLDQMDVEDNSVNCDQARRHLAKQMRSGGGLPEHFQLRQGFRKKGRRSTDK
jgi:hypothetical protein